MRYGMDSSSQQHDATSLFLQFHHENVAGADNSIQDVPVYITVKTSSCIIATGVGLNLHYV